MSEKPIRVLVVDDHAVVRQGLRTFLDVQQDITIAGEAADGREALAQAEALQPDVILMDLVMPRMDGLTAIRELRRRGVSSQVIALTSFSDDDKVIPAIQAGAGGYLLKDVSPGELMAAIRAAAAGESYLDPAIAAQLMQRVTTPTRRAWVPEDDLTPRELDVLRLICKGCSNQEIAGKLRIGEKTVKTHVSHILSKLDVADRTQAALYALRHGLASLDEGEHRG